jgi:hypothetical protein
VQIETAINRCGNWVVLNAYLKPIFLPRQAPDKHEETLKHAVLRRTKVELSKASGVSDGHGAEALIAAEQVGNAASARFLMKRNAHLPRQARDNIRKMEENTERFLLLSRRGFWLSGTRRPLSGDRNAASPTYATHSAFETPQRTWAT